MNSIITKNSFNNCKNLKKVYIGEKVSIENLDLSQTQVKTSNLLKDYQKETDNIIWADTSIIDKARLQGDNDETHLINLIDKLKSLEINVDNQIIKDEQELNQEFDRQIQKKHDLEAKLAEVSAKANSSEVDKELLQKKVDELKELVNDLQEESNQIVDKDLEIAKLKKELAQEQGWWDKWIEDESSNRVQVNARQDTNSLPVFISNYLDFDYKNSHNVRFEINISSYTDYKVFFHQYVFNDKKIELGKKMFKAIAEWYKKQE
jgi:uncharacterized protein YfcZ (UPF0381/DUF406 family)